MCKKTNLKSWLVIAAILVLGLVNSTSGQIDYIWTNAGGNQKWEDANNWNPSGIPSADDTAMVNPPALGPIVDCDVGVRGIDGPKYDLPGNQAMDITGGTIDCNEYWYWAWSGSGTGTINISGSPVITVEGDWRGAEDATGILNISGSPTIDVAESWRGGDQSGSVYVVNVSGGNVSCGGFTLGDEGICELNLSAGTIDIADSMKLSCRSGGSTTDVNMTGGLITVGGEFEAPKEIGGTLTISLHGGTIDCNEFTHAGTQWSMDITEGTLIIDGDVTAAIDANVAAGRITGYNGIGVVKYDYNVRNPGKTTVTAGSPIIYVDADAAGANDGWSWEDAFNHLQDALAAAVSGDQIRVAEGTYKPTSSGDRTATFQLINGVAIYGGFAGAGAGDPNERDVELYETILSGDINTPGDSSDNSYHVVTGSGTDDTAVLEGFTISEGNANGSDPHYNGGGMYNYQGSPTVTNCTFSGNTADANGGAVCNWYSSPTVTNCIFTGNSATSGERGGGGMFNDHSDPMLTNCTFTGNSSTRGGGMTTRLGSPTVTNCTFSGNSAGSEGGGMFNDFSSPTLTNCIIWGNSAPSGPEIKNASSTPTVSYSHIGGADPMFVDADGPDDIVGTEDDDLRLSGGSPCIDAGDNTAVPGGVTTDMDGKPRFREDPFTADTGNGTPPIVDMGAYEYDEGIIFVDADAPGANDGSSWDNAFNYLQDALAEANSNADVNEIWVAEGTYHPDANTANPDGSGEREATFQLLNGVEIYGGFAGAGAPDAYEWDIELYDTILSGDLDGNDVPVYDPCDLLTEPTRGDNSYHVVTGSGTDANAVLDGFTITAGNANGSNPHDRGGGMFNSSGSPTVTNCTFTGNSSGYGGGGMYNDSSSPTVSNCTFIGNTATMNGGGMENNYNSTPTVTNCTFTGNSANYGGGMCSLDSSLSLTVTNCLFIGNAAQSQGGGMFNNNCVGSPTLTNCTFSENSAINYGGAIYNYDSSPTLTNCTFTGNSAGDWGGGVCNKSSSSPTVTNCILWGNTAATGAQIYKDGTSSATVSYSDVEGCGGSGGGWDPNCGTDDGNNIDQDPVYVDANGLDGIAGTADDEEGYVHLRGYSPCINAGDPGGDYSSQVDIDDQPRVAYDLVDMGADEVFPIAGDIDTDEDVDFG
ncbi:MAG: right-handed parallel beta-helix repeat-containing protein, partial [Planctomycetota bacterium]